MNNNFDLYVNSYSDIGLRNAITKTRDKFQSEVIEKFDWASEKQVLLYGDVQSGKTSHMLGLIAHATDQGIRNTLLLTSDNSLLVDQTFERALTNFTQFNVCDSNDEKRFNYNSNRGSKSQPNLIVLNKNKSVLSRWKRILSNAEALHGQPLLIVDDEADAASLDNNLGTTKPDRTAINKILTEIRHQSASCIYLQVTGTPQAILLQAQRDKWRPDLAFSFSPGPSYIGGDLLFETIVGNSHLKITSDTFGYRAAVINHLVTSAIFRRLGEETCNMLVHPSHRTGVHEDFVKETSSILSSVQNDLYSSSIQNSINLALKNLCETCNEEFSISEITHSIEEIFAENLPKVIIVNSNSVANEEDWKSGTNILIGGNSLGRGLTVGRLQTVFYSRKTTSPNADTLWQHARMFGYDRRPELLRVYMPGNIAKIFQEVHQGNKAIKAQIALSNNLDDIQVILPKGINPTRSTALNKDQMSAFHGGVNYFAGNPKVSDVRALEERITHLTGDEEESVIAIRAMITLLSHFTAHPDDFPVQSYIGALENFCKERPNATGVLIVRRNRQVRQGTGSLLSESDRHKSDSIEKDPVLTLYRIEGDYGWLQDPIWVPNIKLPVGPVYYRSR